MTAASNRIAYLDGALVDEDQVRLSFRDAGAFRGEGVYDSARTFDGRVMWLRPHLERLWRSLAYLRIEPPIGIDELERVSLEVAAINYERVGADIWVTQRVTAGVPPEFGGTGTPTVIVECFPIPFASRAATFRDGIRALTPTVRRTPPWAVSPHAKTVDLLNLRLAAMEVAAVDPAALALVCDENGNLAEGPGANVFAVSRGVLVTPRVDHVLPGVTRQVVIELAHEIGLEVVERDVPLFDAYTADELFVTSTSYCICPVASLNGARPRAGRIPGPVTERLQDAFSARVGIDVVDQYLRHADAGAAPVAS